MVVTQEEEEESEEEEDDDEEDGGEEAAYLRRSYSVGKHLKVSAVVLLIPAEMRVFVLGSPVSQVPCVCRLFSGPGDQQLRALPQMLRWELGPLSVTPAAALLSRCVSRGALTQVRGKS